MWRGWSPDTLVVSAGAGLLLGALYTASPLTTCALAAYPFVLWLALRDLPADERRTAAAVVTAALAVRLLLVAVLLVAGIPRHDDLAVGSLRGDEAYNLTRALRTRDVLLGVATTKYDYVVAFDEYGRSSYLWFLTALQVVFGPTPFGMRVLNAVLFLAGALLLFRLARRAFGFVPALGGLLALVFLPSLIYASTTVLKESSYFLAGAALVVSSIQVLRPRSWPRALGALAVAAVSLWLLSDLRRGAEILAPAGIACGLLLRVAAATPRRAIAFAVVIAASSIALLSQPAVAQRVTAGLESAAKMHAGHVFTVGHAYKLLDDGFYVNPQTPAISTITLTPDQAARFVIRAGWAFLTTPLPWQAASKYELAVLPEQIAWYLLLLGLPAGVIAGWRRDALVTAVLVGFVLPTAAVLALTNGNVGTLVRLRGLVTPYVIWISVLGGCAVLEALARRTPLSSEGRGPSAIGVPDYAPHR